LENSFQVGKRYRCLYNEVRPTKDPQKILSQQSVAACYEICVPIWQIICSGPGGPGTGFEEDWVCVDTYLGQSCFINFTGGGDDTPQLGGPNPGDNSGQNNEIDNNISNPCLKDAVDQSLSASKNIKGAIADIIHKFDASQVLK
jgi:hypothetical protein